VSQRRARTFFGGDRYAAFALGLVPEADGSFAGGDVYVAARGVSQSVIPGFDHESLIVYGGEQTAVDAAEEMLLGRASSRELWNQPTLAMELQSYITQLIYSGEVFVRLHFDRSSPDEAYSLFAADWLAPETIVRRRARGKVVFEQYISVRAFEGTNYVMQGGPREYLAAFPAEEVLHLRWPLAQPDGERSPAAAALTAARAMGRDARRTLLVAQAGAEPEEKFLAIARARAGAFKGALEGQQVASARIKDMLFYPGAYEAPVFPWVEHATAYFLAERALRSRVAQLNGWCELKLGLRRDVFGEQDWLAFKEELTNGTVDLEDVLAAVTAESEGT
jgi:hypothetical protein